MAFPYLVDPNEIVACFSFFNGGPLDMAEEKVEDWPADEINAAYTRARCIVTDSRSISY